MKNETQPFNHLLHRRLALINGTQMTNQKLRHTLSITFSCMLFSACSFVELNPAASYIILANDKESCETLKSYNAEVTTTNFFVDRSERAIAEDLQIKALNKAYESKANAIWPTTEVVNGKQNFDILRCKYK